MCVQLQEQKCLQSHTHSNIFVASASKRSNRQAVAYMWPWREIRNEPARRPQARGASLTQGVYPKGKRIITYMCQKSHIYVTWKEHIRVRSRTHTWHKSRTYVSKLTHLCPHCKWACPAATSPRSKSHPGGIPGVYPKGTQIVTYVRNFDTYM